MVHTGKERGRKNDEVCVCVCFDPRVKRESTTECVCMRVCVVYGRVRDRGELCVCERDRRREREGEGERARGELCVCERG